MLERVRAVYEEARKEVSEIATLGAVRIIEVEDLEPLRYAECELSDYGFFTIRVATEMAKYSTDYELKNILAHELIHTVDGAYDHGELFQQLMKEYNKRFDGFVDIIVPADWFKDTRVLKLGGEAI